MEASMAHCATEYTKVPPNVQTTLPRRDMDRLAGVVVNSSEVDFNEGSQTFMRAD